MKPHETEVLRPELSALPARIARLPLHRGTGLPLLMEGCAREVTVSDQRAAQAALLKAREGIGVLLPA